jgi:hypothetical protein
MLLEQYEFTIPAICSVSMQPLTYVEGAVVSEKYGKVDEKRGRVTDR